MMELRCCACGKEVPELFFDAVEDTIYSREDGAPFGGSVVCEDCKWEIANEHNGKKEKK